MLNQNNSKFVDLGFVIVVRDNEYNLVLNYYDPLNIQLLVVHNHLMVIMINDRIVLNVFVMMVNEQKQDNDSLNHLVYHNDIDEFCRIMTAFG
jgi:hypothetical protein